MLPLGGGLAWAAVCLLSHLAGAQTIQSNGQAIPANERTVSPAAAQVPSAEFSSGTEYFDFEKTQLTNDVLSNLTALQLTDISLFNFASQTALNGRQSPLCKAYPGTPEWPSDVTWKVLDLLVGGRLSKTIPLAAPCFDSWPTVRDNATCAYINASWRTPRFQIDDPASVNSPLYEGRTCMPYNGPNGNCTVGGFPAYVVNVSNVADIQLAVNMASNANLRFVIKNKGHDFNAKSTGGGGLSVYTNYLRDIRFLPSYSRGRYQGPAFKVGTGVEVQTLYQEAEKLNLSIVGGIGRTVGLAGGYSAGGGHSLLSSLYGMGSDQLLALEVVLPSGRFVTVTEDHSADLYWALRGGGGSTFGVVTSAIVPAYPKNPVATLTYSLTTANGDVSADTWWAGIQAFWETFIPNADDGQYVYFRIICQAPTQPDNCTLTMAPHWANNKTAAQLEAWQAPFFNKLTALGIPILNPVYKEYPSVYTAFNATFPLTGEVAGGTTTHTGSRLFPRANWENATLLNETAAAIRHTLATNGRMLAYNYKAAVNPRLNQTNALTPAWRRAIMFAMMANPWVEGSNTSTIVEKSRQLVERMQPWRDVTPGAGSYLNEGDINEPDFQQAFYGENYPRLYELKQKYDPTGTFYAATAVGSEDWYVTGQIPFYPTSNGRLCRRTS